MSEAHNNERNVYRELTEIRSIIGTNNADMRVLIAAQTATLHAVDAKVDATNDSMRRMWESQNEQDKEIATLKTKAAGIAAVAGFAVAGGIAAVKYFFTKE